MSVVGGPELLEPLTSEPFPNCEFPPVLFGTGTLGIVDPTTGVEIDAGNFTAVGLNEDAEGFRYFGAAESEVSPGAVTAAWRLSLTGDLYHFDHVAKIVNGQRTAYVGGEFVSLGTVRTLPVFRVVFRRVLYIADPCDPQTCPTLELELWRVHFDATAAIAMARAQAVLWPFDLIALPDWENHPGSPFGVLREICPVGRLS